MAAAIKALNAKIRSNKYTDYICSTRRFCLFLPHHPSKNIERKEKERGGAAVKQGGWRVGAIATGRWVIERFWSGDEKEGL